MTSPRSIALVACSLFVAVAAPASAAICSPATCGDAGKTRSLDLAAPKHKQTSLRVKVVGARARVTVTGPHHFKRAIRTTTTFRDARPGSYLVVADALSRKDVTTFATYRRTRARLRKGVAGTVEVRFAQRVKNTTRVADAAAIATVKGDAGGMREIAVEDPKRAIVPGSILAAGIGPATPYGLLVKVDSITRSGTKTIARGGPAALTALGASGEIEAAPALELSEAQLLGSPRTFKSVAPNSFTRDLQCAGGPATVRGSVGLKATTQLDIAWNGTTRRTSVDADVTQSATLDVRTAGAAECTLDADVLDQDLRFAPVQIMVGPVPVVVVPKLNFHLTGTTASQAAESAALTQRSAGRFGARWDGDAFTGSGSGSATFAGVRAAPNARTTLAAAVAPRLSFDLYDASGPWVEAASSLRLDGDAGTWDLTSGLRATAGTQRGSAAGAIWTADWPVAAAQAPTTGAPAPADDPAPVFTTTTLPNAVFGTPYSATIAATSTVGPLRYALASGNLPGGLSLDPATGTIGGTVTSYGSYRLVVSARDSRGQTTERTFTLAIDTLPLTVTTSTLTAGTIGAVYRASLTASGSQPSYRWSVVAGALPPGLSLSVEGRVDGTPTSEGSFTFTVRGRGADAHEGERELTLVVDPAALRIPAQTLGAGKVGVAYSSPLTATGGRMPYTWSATPVAGLSVSAGGTVSGSPAQLGTATLNVTVTDADSRTATAQVDVTIAGADDPLRVATTELPAAQLGGAYARTLTAADGRPPYTWSAGPGGVPAGLTIAADGTVSGTATNPADTVLSATVTDADGHTAWRSIAMYVVGPGLTQTPKLAPDTHKADPYGFSPEVTGGTGPYTWSVASGSLPAGLTLDVATGRISGVSGEASTVTRSFTLAVQDDLGATDTRSYSIKSWAGDAMTVPEISCPTGGFCVAADATKYVYRLVGDRWSAKAVPPGFASEFGLQVSCVAEDWCMVISTYGKVAIWNGAAWTAAPALAGADVYGDVDCVTPTYCVATAGTFDRPGIPEAWSVRVWDGSAWSPGAPAIQDATLASLDCPAVDDCVLSSYQWSATFDGTSLTPLATPFVGAESLACPSATLCLAGAHHSGTWAFDGAGWTASSITHGSGPLWLMPLGCSRAGATCAGAGDDGNDGALTPSLWTWDGTAWTHSLALNGAYVRAISCGSRALCVATTAKGQSTIWNGSTWSALTTFAFTT